MLRRRLVLIASLAALGAGLLTAGPAAAHPRHRASPVRFEVRPRLALVTPGLEVVVDYGEEVFVYAGWWWTRHDGRWYRAAAWDAPWRAVSYRRVPTNLERLPDGRYRHYRPREYRTDREDRREHLREARKADRKAARTEAKADRHRDKARAARADGRGQAARQHARKAGEFERKADDYEREARRARRAARL